MKELFLPITFLFFVGNITVLISGVFLGHHLKYLSRTFVTGSRDPICCMHNKQILFYGKHRCMLISETKNVLGIILFYSKYIYMCFYKGYVKFLNLVVTPIFSSKQHNTPYDVHKYNETYASSCGWCISFWLQLVVRNSDVSLQLVS